MIILLFISVIASIFCFIGGTVFGMTSIGVLKYFLKYKKKVKINVQASKVHPSSCVVYEEINYAESTSSKPIEL